MSKQSAAAPSFEAPSIEPFLTRIAPLKKRAGRLVLADEERAYGEAFSLDLATLLLLQEHRALPDVGVWRLFDDPRPLAAGEGPDLADGLGLLGPLCAIYPIAQNQGADLVFATMRPAGDPRSWIYLFEAEESRSLQRTHHSIAHFVWSHALITTEVEDGLFGADDAATRRFAKEQSAWVLEPLEDPLVLFARSRWLVRALAEEGDFVDLTKSRKVPGLVEWKRERGLLTDAPHLALYWLLAHWLAGNAAMLQEALKITEPMTNLDVRAVRRRVESERPSGFLAQVRAQLPARMRSPEAVGPANTPADLDPRAHEKRLKQAFSTASAVEKKWVATYSALVRGLGSRRPGDVATQKSWAAGVDARFLLPILALVRRSFDYPKSGDPRALSWIIEALGRLGPSSPHREVVLETLLGAPIMSKLYDERVVEVIGAVGAFDDARIEPWMERVVEQARTTNFVEQQETFEAALSQLAARNPKRAARIAAQVLAKRDRSSSWLHDAARSVVAAYQLRG